MKFLIVGAGSIGTRYGKLVQRLGGTEVVVVEPDDNRRAQFLAAVAARSVASFGLALDEHPDVAIICSPTSMHTSHCLQALRGGCHVLLEKPISNRLDGIEALYQEAQSRGRVVLVSCNFRFDPALSQMKDWIQSGLVGRVLTCRATFGQDLRECRPDRDYRTVYAANRSLGGGVLLDCVHEIDYLSWFFGSVESVSAMTAKLSDLEMDTEDSANLLLHFSSGVQAIVQLDYFRPEYNRSFEVIGTEGMLQWSYSPKMLRHFSRASGLWSTRAMDEKGSIDVMYSDQLQHFLKCVEGTAEPAQGIRDAAQTLVVVQAAHQSAESHKEVAVASREPEASSNGRAKAANVRDRSGATKKTVAIIQARMASTRLPGKIFANIGGRPMIRRVVERVKEATALDDVIVATTVEPCDDPVASYCAVIGVACFRGSETDVLERYYKCAEEAAASTVIRITGDCPLIDPSMVDQMVRTFQATMVDYASNRRYGSPHAVYAFPDGLDVEIFSFEALRCAHAEAAFKYDREHVTPFIWRNTHRFSVLYTQSPEEFPNRQWTVDYWEDLEFVRRIYRLMGNAKFGLAEVRALLKENPEISAVNGHLSPGGDWRYASRTGSASIIGQE